MDEQAVDRLIDKAFRSLWKITAVWIVGSVSIAVGLVFILFGMHQQVIERIVEKLDTVTVSAHGNSVTISQPRTEADNARDILIKQGKIDPP